jgi:hypothetical protein
MSDAAGFVAVVVVTTVVTFMWPLLMDAAVVIAAACGCRRARGCARCDEDGVAAAKFLTQLVQVWCARRCCACGAVDGFVCTAPFTLLFLIVQRQQELMDAEASLAAGGLSSPHRPSVSPADTSRVPLLYGRP